MFCLDYAVAFCAHYAIASNVSESTQCHPLFTFPVGAAAGGIAAVLLYPFDIVRQSTVAPGQSHFAFSTVPFMAAYIGIYFLQPRWERDAKPLGERALWAVGATAAAAAAELPFDRSKIAITGGNLRSAAVANGLRVPLGAALLLAYDQILSSTSRRRAALAAAAGAE